MNNPVIALKQYIRDHKNDDCGSWEYMHTPHIEYVLGQLDEYQTDEFCHSIWHWSEFHLSELANPIIFCSNTHMDGLQLYLRIFGKLSDIEKLEYFAEKMGEYLSTEALDKLAVEDLEMLLKNMQRVSGYIKSESYRNQYKEIEDDIKRVIQYKIDTKDYS